MGAAIPRVALLGVVLPGLALLAASGCGADPKALPPPPAPAARSFGPPRPEDARVPRIASISDYRGSGDRPYWAPLGKDRRSRWTPEEIVGLLSDSPGYYLDMGIWTGRPNGHESQREVGRVVNEVQALGRARGVDTSRIAVQWRNDMYVKMRDGHPPCGSDCGWEGRMRGHPFDPAWILTVPRSEQRWAVEHRWGGDPRKDPWSEAGRDRWASWVDREAIAAVDTPERVAALYVLVHDTDPSLLHADPAPTVVGVDMDLRLPAYRAWSVQRLLADLRVLGIDPGEAAVVFYAYKPGWHVWYGGGRDPAQPCFVPDAHLWTGPAGTCPLPKRWSEGPFNRTPYGPGEFEASISAMLREMRAGLDGAGYDRVGIVTVERPGFTARKWSALAPDLRRAPWLLGELGTACDRREPARSRCPRR